MDNEVLYVILIYISVVLALVWAALNAYLILRIKPIENEANDGESLHLISTHKVNLLIDIGKKISNGANAFLFQEYLIMFIFIIIFGVIVLFVVDFYGEGSRTI